MCTIYILYHCITQFDLLDIIIRHKKCLIKWCYFKDFLKRGIKWTLAFETSLNLPLFTSTARKTTFSIDLQLYARSDGFQEIISSVEIFLVLFLWVEHCKVWNRCKKFWGQGFSRDKLENLLSINRSLYCDCCIRV